MPDRPRLRDAALAFSVGFVLGAGIPAARQLLCGNADPFESNWPLFLQAAACLSAFFVSWTWRQIAASAAGISVGLAAYLFTLGESEYPGSSLIALAIHGFVPAFVGSLLALAVHRWQAS